MAELGSKYKSLPPYGTAVSECSSRHAGIYENMIESSGMYDSYYHSVDDNSIINPSIHSTLIIPHSIENNQSATHSVSKTDPKLNVYATDDQHTEIMRHFDLSNDTCPLSSNTLELTIVHL